MTRAISARHVLPPTTTDGVKNLIGRFRRLEGQGAGLGPQLSPSKIQAMIASAKGAEKHFQSLRNLSKDDQREWAGLIEELTAYRLGCEYRVNGIEEVGRELDPDEQKVLDALRGRVRDIKREGKLYVGAQEWEELTEQEEAQLERLTKVYPDAAQFLLQCSQGRLETFMKFCLRSNCSIDVFVQFQVERELIMEAHIDKRIGGALGPQGLVVRDGQVMLLIDGRYESVHDKSRHVELRNLVDARRQNYRLTLKDLYQQFQSKTSGYGNVEVFGVDARGNPLGVVNWDSIRQGSYDPVSKQVVRFDSSNWEEMPGFVLTRDEIQARYPGQELCQGDQWGVAFCASRLTPHVSISESHAYVTVFIPLEDGRYKALPIGLQPYGLPSTTCGKMLYLGSTEQAEIHFPDESYFLSNRQHMGMFAALDAEERFALKEIIRYEVDKGRRGEKIFQAQGNNCANFVMKVLYKLFVKRHLLSPLVDMLGGNEGARRVVKELESAARVSDDKALDVAAKKIVDHFGRGELIALILNCRDVLEKTLFKDNLGALEGIDFDEMELVDVEQLKSITKDLLVQTLKSQQIFRAHILNADLKTWFFNFLKNVLNFFIKIGLLTKEIASFLLWVFQVIVLAPWRFKVIKTKNGKRIKSVIGSKYFWTGNQLIPSSMWEWKGKNTEFQADVNRCFHRINTFSERDAEMQKEVVKVSRLFAWAPKCFERGGGTAPPFFGRKRDEQSPLSFLLGGQDSAVERARTGS